PAIPQRHDSDTIVRNRPDLFCEWVIQLAQDCRLLKCRTSKQDRVGGPRPLLALRAALRATLSADNPGLSRFFNASNGDTPDCWPPKPLLQAFNQEAQAGAKGPHLSAGAGAGVWSFS